MHRIVCSNSSLLDVYKVCHDSPLSFLPLLIWSSHSLPLVSMATILPIVLTSRKSQIWAIDVSLLLLYDQFQRFWLKALVILPFAYLKTS